MSEAAATAFDQGTQAPPAEPAPEASAPIDTTIAEQASPEERAWLGESYRSDPRLGKFNNPDDLAKSYLSAESLIGKSIRIPGQDASDKQRAEFFAKLEEVQGVAHIPTDPQDQEAWDKFYDRMGRPESPDGYSVKDEDVQKLHHSLGLSESQSARLQRFEEQRTTANQQANNDAVIEAGDALKAEWGEGAERNFTNVKLAAQQFGGEALVNELTTNPAIGNNIPLLKALVEVANTMGDKSVPLNSTAQSFNMTVQEANEQIAELRENPAYQNREQWALDRMRTLYEKSTPKS